MPNRKRKVQMPPDGREVTAEEIPIQSSTEHWNEYLLSDGSVVRMKNVVTEALRLEGEYDPAGNPVYIVQSTNVMNVSAPDELRRKG